MSPYEDQLLLMMNLQKSIEREKYLSEKLEQQRRRMLEKEELIIDLNDEYSDKVLKRWRENKISDLSVELSVTRRQKEKCTMELINKEEICVTNTQELQAVIFLKKAGWKGSALVLNQDDFTAELANNNIPFNFLFYVP